MTQTCLSKIQKKLEAMRYTLYNLNDLRDRGYPIEMGQICALKDKIRLLEELED